MAKLTEQQQQAFGISLLFATLVRSLTKTTPAIKQDIVREIWATHNRIDGVDDRPSLSADMLAWTAKAIEER